MELVYREAIQHDLEEIVRIYNSTIPSRMVTADIAPVSVESRQKWFDEHSADKHPLWVISDVGFTDVLPKGGVRHPTVFRQHVSKSEIVIGWASFQAFLTRPAYHATVEISIYLDEKCRGMGYGREILKHCIEQAPKLGIKSILGLIFAHNEPSLRLFEGMGFEEWANMPKIAEMDGREYGLKILGLRV
jgi:L-amino acid N-acyltransferase YncA